MRQFFITCASLTILLLPAAVLADGLVPCGGPDEVPCSTDLVVSFVAGIINFLISMLGVIAMIILVYAGFQMVISMGNEAAWTKAKSLFSNVIIGIVLILAAWLIVDTIMRALTGEGLNYWSDFNR